MSKKRFLSTDLFKNKPAPDFIKNHSLFRNPVLVQKVFPAIGLPNFKEKANINKCLVDIKKEGTYVHNLLRTMSDILAGLQQNIATHADKIQFLDTKETRETGRDKLAELYNFANAAAILTESCDPFGKIAFAETVQFVDDKIAIRLPKDIVDTTGKPMFRNGESLFKVFGKIREKAITFGIPFHSLDQQETFKVFNKENIPNKEFNVIFSSDGEEGAWDIATMSMRGIKSCQRWDGEYPRCLIGSILSKFVGVMYLTSGVQSDDHPSFPKLGTKMMRRCVIRYAVDADEEKPCILIDKMYPELDKDILAIFVNAIKSKTDLPVYYAQDLGNKLRHIYLPSEKIRQEVIDREWSYQDTPLKSQEDLNIFYLNCNKDEIERDIKVFAANFGLFIANRFEDVIQRNVSVDPEIRKTINNVRMNTPLSAFSNSIAAYVMTAFRAPASKGFTSGRQYYRKYVMEFLLKRKQIAISCTPNLEVLFKQFTSRQVDSAAFSAYVATLATEFAKNELKKIRN